jgi:hypothetical protein
MMHRGLLLPCRAVSFQTRPLAQPSGACYLNGTAKLWLCEDKVSVCTKFGSVGGPMWRRSKRLCDYLWDQAKRSTADEFRPLDDPLARLKLVAQTRLLPLVENKGGRSVNLRFPMHSAEGSKVSFSRRVTGHGPFADPIANGGDNILLRIFKCSKACAGLLSASP